MTAASTWTGAIRIRRRSAADADRIAEALAPEVAREVPRVVARLLRPDDRTLEIRIAASDTSACRAALNTYLAWVGLVLATERAAGLSGPSAEPEDSSVSRSA